LIDKAIRHLHPLLDKPGKNVTGNPPGSRQQAAGSRQQAADSKIAR